MSSPECMLRILRDTVIEKATRWNMIKLPAGTLEQKQQCTFQAYDERS